MAVREVSGVRIKHLSKTEAAWMVKNPVLLPGEIGFNSATGRMKVGDGVSRWSELPYVTAGETLIATSWSRTGDSDLDTGGVFFTLGNN